MRTAVPITELTCPDCKSLFAPVAPGDTECPRCGWRGKAYLFAPSQAEVQVAEIALGEDATCLHHPRKKAVAVCAGTGDYICSLCAIELNGQTYSAEYLNAGGHQTAAKAFDRTLPRPDSQIYTYLLLCLLPYVNIIFLAFLPVWMPHAFICYARALRMRKENPLFRRLMGMWRVVILPILLSIFSLLWLGGAVALVFGMTRGFR